MFPTCVAVGENLAALSSLDRNRDSVYTDGKIAYYDFFNSNSLAIYSSGNKYDIWSLIYLWESGRLESLFHPANL